MKLGDVIKKERERKKLSFEHTASQLGLSEEEYREIENGQSPAEEWGPRLALIAIKTEKPTSRLLAESGKSAALKLTLNSKGRARLKKGKPLKATLTVVATNAQGESGTLTRSVTIKPKRAS